MSPSHDTTFRLATDSDTGAIATMADTYLRPDYLSDLIASGKIPQNQYILVAERDDKIIGFAYFYPKSGEKNIFYLMHIVVEPNYRSPPVNGNLLFTELLEKAAEEAKKLGATNFQTGLNNKLGGYLRARGYVKTSDVGSWGKRL